MSLTPCDPSGPIPSAAANSEQERNTKNSPLPLGGFGPNKEMPGMPCGDGHVQGTAGEAASEGVLGGGRGG